jgi:bifunctional UDP-N-acetylglucosamine pyrophosphorylase/glucosamine-1-phosphate N-acetyltransferase
VVTLEVEDDGTLLGINDRTQLADAEVEMRLRINEAHMRAGVTMQDPASTFIDADVQIAEDVTLEPGVALRGVTVIERDAVIRTGSQIFDTRIGQRTVVWASVLEGSIVESDVTIGPFSHLRKGAHIGSDVELGNYAEVKNSNIGAGTKSHHFSYLGDADVGEKVNIGAGSITANYDGKAKHRTRIGKGAFIGADTILRAPVSVGEGSYTGAASLVTRDVPDGKMALGVPARIRDRRSEADDPPSDDPPSDAPADTTGADPSRSEDGPDR